MTIRPRDLGGFGVDEWFVIFHEQTDHPWIDRLIPGRFKHVSAVGWCPRARVWVGVNWTWRRVEIDVWPREVEADLLRLHMAGPALRILSQWTDGPVWGRFGWWCVPMTAHLVGVRTCALRPDRLWRVLLANGAEPVDEERPADEEAQGRPGGGAPAGDRAA